MIYQRPTVQPTNGGDNTIYLVTLTVQTGMPLNTSSRSRELIYDSLGNLYQFILNPYGPQPLYVARPEHHW